MAKKILVFTLVLLMGCMPLVSCKDDSTDSKGKSAYELALQNGFSGSEQDWIKSLSAISNNIIVVDASGKGDYKTIQAAVNAASNGDTIYIKNGTYTETVKCRTKYLNFLGENRYQTILTYTNKSYYNPPLEMAMGSVSNLTIHATADANPENMTAYCIHADYDEQKNNTLIVKDCDLINDNRAAIGIGLRANNHIMFDNCYIESKSGTTAAYFHDDAAYTSVNQKLSFVDCTIVANSSTEPAILLQSQENDRPDSSATLCVQRCIIKNNGTSKNFSATVWGKGGVGSNPWDKLTTWTLDPLSSLNTAEELNAILVGPN